MTNVEDPPAKDRV